MTEKQLRDRADASRRQWIVVTDFDGTITERDIGNEIATEVLREKFKALYKDYKAGKYDLKGYQQVVWKDFPLSEKGFKQLSLKFSKLRPGVTQFFEQCAAQGVPVYVASCGIRPYIEACLETHLSREGFKALKEIRSNEVRFEGDRMIEFIAPTTSADCPYPLDKGGWCDELRLTYPGAKILGIGNGSSDRSFHGHVDALAATEDLATWCKKEGVDFLEFEDFRQLLDKGPFAQ